MFRKRINSLGVILLALAVFLTATSCEQLKLNNLQANYHFKKANNLFREGKYRDAVTEYELTLKYRPDLVQAYRYIGESYKQLYKPGLQSELNKELERKALEALNKALEFEPNNIEIIYSLGDMYDKLRNFEEAEKLYLRILELDPQNMDNFYVVAEFYSRYAGEIPDAAQKAETMYLRRIEADPENPMGYAYTANYYQQLPVSEQDVEGAIRNFDKANEFWEKRIALDPDNPEAWLAKGVNRWSRAYRFQNVPASERLVIARDALEAIEKARDLDPEYPEPYSWLSVLYQSVLANLEPDKAARYTAEGQKNLEKFQELRKRAAERKKLEEELKAIK
ncbi:MAG: tetratricopeptide repeat protein [Acidobacteriota bacterium]|nr:tetratricopeptide repeat protein [Acidobacteriota bacterium]MDW3228227.1 tetratricopeptide repeat protein [Acidobacteriota bacterium]MDY0232347.1 tetratricopeptide repeat protein [Candidatus Saccharicenans sp.]